MCREGGRLCGGWGPCVDRSLVLAKVEPGGIATVGRRGRPFGRADPQAGCQGRQREDWGGALRGARRRSCLAFALPRCLGVVWASGRHLILVREVPVRIFLPLLRRRRGRPPEERGVLLRLLLRRVDLLLLLLLLLRALRGRRLLWRLLLLRLLLGTLRRQLLLLLFLRALDLGVQGFQLQGRCWGLLRLLLR